MFNMITTTKLTKKFNSFTAVDGINLDIRKGELFGLLGPNGAGKSTTIYMLTTLLASTSGKAIVNGFDIATQSDEVRKSIGVVFQDPTVDTRLSAFDNLDIHGRLYGMNKAEREKRINEVLKLVDLVEWKHKIVKTFSSGMRRRLEIARGLMHTPTILFLDEPTLGLDPQTRRNIWGYIEKLKREGMTIVLTTHYLEEADYLCDRVAIIDHGRIVAIDTPSKLKELIRGDVVELESSDPKGIEALLNKSKLGTKFRETGKLLRFKVKDGSRSIAKIMALADRHGIKIESIELHKPSLEDVFLHYTGRLIREEKAPSMEMMRRRIRGH